MKSVPEFLNKFLFVLDWVIDNSINDFVSVGSPRLFLLSLHGEGLTGNIVS